jgi:hypothetical protein
MRVAGFVDVTLTAQGQNVDVELTQEDPQSVQITQPAEYGETPSPLDTRQISTDDPLDIRMNDFTILNATVIGADNRAPVVRFKCTEVC